MARGASGAPRGGRSTGVDMQGEKEWLMQAVLFARLAAVAIPLALSAGCVTWTSTEKDDILNDVARLKQDMRDLKGPSSGSGVRDQIADTNNRLTSIETQLAQLKGVDEDLEHRLAQVEGDVQAIRGGAPPGGMTPAGVTPGVPGALPGPGQPGTVPPSTGANDQFDAAMRSFQEGRYREADTFFSEYIRENPRSPKIEDAYFYKAESQFAEANYEDAIVTYDEFRKRFRGSRLVAPALLKQGLAFKALGFKSDARTFFRELIRLYPNSAEAAQARKELDAL